MWLMAFNVEFCNLGGWREITNSFMPFDCTFQKKKKESCTAGAHICLTSEEFGQFKFAHIIDKDESTLGQISAFRKRIYVSCVSDFAFCSFPERNTPPLLITQDNINTLLNKNKTTTTTGLLSLANVVKSICCDQLQDP